MKTFTLALVAATLISGSAFAEEITGTVHTATLVHCGVGTGCTNTITSATITSEVGGLSKTTTLSGDLSKLADLNGKIATVDGTGECLNGGDTCRFSVSSAKPSAAQPLTSSAPKAAFVTPASVGSGALKPENNVLTGMVHSECMNGADSCHATLTVGDKTYGLSGNFSKIAKFDGKIATVKGALAMCGAGMGGCGESIIVSSIKAAAAMPLTAASDSGSNVGRDASTTPILVHCEVGVGCSNTPVKSEGAGIKRN